VVLIGTDRLTVMSYRMIKQFTELCLYRTMSLNYKLAHLPHSKFEISLLGKLPITTALTQHGMAYNNTEDISEMPSG